MTSILPFLSTLFFSSFLLFNPVKGQQWIAQHTFAADETAVYPAASFITHQSVPVLLRFPAGATLTFQTANQVQFQRSTTVYGSNGAETYSAFSGAVFFPAGKTMAVPPGTTMSLQTASSVLRFGQFNGNNAGIVNYPNGAQLTFNCPSQPSYFPAGTNTINFYNPGADNAGVATQFGPSAPAVGSVAQIQVTTTGFTQSGFPIRTSRNIVTGEVLNVVQIGQTIFNVTRI